MKIISEIIGDCSGENKECIRNRIIESLKKQIKEEIPRCLICGRFFGVDEVINDEVVSVIKQDNHYQSEQQWYEHRKCRG